MQCAHCGFVFKVLLVDGDDNLPDVAPVVCEKCMEVNLLVGGKVRKLTDGEMAALKAGPAWQLVASLRRRISSVKNAMRASNN